MVSSTTITKQLRRSTINLTALIPLFNIDDEVVAPGDFFIPEVRTRNDNKK
jgi:hypothetical protein